MLPYLQADYGNPHSTDHQHGWEAARAVARARTELAEILGADPAELIFTSGATEANNLALKGIIQSPKLGLRRLIVSAIDHKSILETAKFLEMEGVELTVIGVNSIGIVDLSELEAELKRGQALVSIGLVNSELGVIQPMLSIVELCRKYDSLIHTDASQAIGRKPIDFYESDIDLLSFSGHKIYGPKGVGGLLVKRSLRQFLKPQIHGGGQEDGARSGTVAPFLVVGLAAAAEFATGEGLGLQASIANLRNSLRSAIVDADPNCHFNGLDEQKIAGNINVTLSKIEADILISRISSELSISTSSACSTGSVQPSHVLKAINLSDAEARRTVRLCVGNATTQKEINMARDILMAAISQPSRSS
jgi:cysteine desulfurase